VKGGELSELTEGELTDLYEMMVSNESFTKQEVHRFQMLLQTSGRQYGGEKYELQVNIFIVVSFCVLTCCAAA
jgi:hypothetical protein